MSRRTTAGRYAPVAVLEWDVHARSGALTPATPHRAVRVLARHRGAPVGFLQFEQPPPELPTDALLEQLASQHGSEWRRQSVKRLLGELSDDAPPLHVTVVVCTRDRTESLARCLDSLRALEDACHEVVVVDNAPSSDATARLVADLAPEWPAVRYVREERPGLDWARNRGLAEARGAVVAYTDDDVRVDRGWVRAIRHAFDEPHVSLVTGLVVPAELATDAQVIFEDWYGGMGKGMRPIVWRGPELVAGQRLGAHHLGVGANMAARRSWLEHLGGFDTALDVGTPSHGAGDLDLFHRTLLAGGTVRYEPTAIVWHYHRRELGALRRQLADNGRAFAVYLLTRLRLEPPRAVLRYALGTWILWMVLRVPRRLMRREKLPLSLQVPEWIGLLQSPFAWLATRRYDRRIRASHPPAFSSPRQTG